MCECDEQRNIIARTEKKELEKNSLRQKKKKKKKVRKFLEKLEKKRKNRN
jgi:hypothetical protein